MKNILVLVHDDAGQEARLQAALDVTRALNGHLTLLDVAAMHFVPGSGLAAEPAALLIDEERRTEAANKARLEQRLAVEDVSWDWKDTSGFFEPCVEQAATLADLIVVNRRIEKFRVPDMDHLCADLIVRSGKPILAVPDDMAAFDAAGRALVAWDGSPAASAALTAAVPLLKVADSVTLIEVDDGSVETPAEEAATYLSRHGISPRIERSSALRRGAGSVIGDRVADGTFSYLVMGGFSHSRFVEALFGGVTRKLLAESPIPLFLAH